MDPITGWLAARGGLRVAGIGSGTIESLKWLGLIVMVAEHWMRYVVGELPLWMYRCGRLALPLFVFALALGLRSLPGTRMPAVTLRMFAWALVAQASLQLVEAPEGQLNVLFTLGLGVAIVLVFERIRSPLVRALALCAAAVTSLWCEFGPIGTAFVAGTVGLARSRNPPPAAWAAAAALLVALALPNRSHFALAAVPAALLVWQRVITPDELRALQRAARIRGPAEAD